MAAEDDRLRARTRARAQGEGSSAEGGSGGRTDWFGSSTPFTNGLHMCGTFLAMQCEHGSFLSHWLGQEGRDPTAGGVRVWGTGQPAGRLTDQARKMELTFCFLHVP